MALKPETFMGKTWFDSVTLCIEDIGEIYFNSANVYAYEKSLSAAYPKNNNVQQKIRQTLQYIRDAGIIEFLNDKGNYRLLDLSLLSDLKIDHDKFQITKTALPNAPLSEVMQKKQSDIEGSPRSKTNLDRLGDAALGEAGEQVILFKERVSLIRDGRGDLAEKTEQVSKTKGDSIGYDILSFTASGEEKWIEVKTTKGRQSTKFHISENQISKSEGFPDKYQLHRLYDFDIEKHTSNLYMVMGNLRNQLALTPTNYSALPI